MNVTGNQVRQKRRMAGIPPLATDFVMPETASGAPAGLLSVNGSEPTMLPEASTVQARTEAVPAVAVPVAKRAIGRRLNGPSNAPLLVAVNGEADAGTASRTALHQETARKEGELTRRALAVEGGPTTTAEVAATTTTRRRMPGPSTVPLLALMHQSAPEGIQDYSEEASGTSGVESGRRRLVEPLPQTAATTEPAQDLVVADQATNQTAIEPDSSADNKKKQAASRSVKLALQVAALVLVAVLAVLIARWLRETAGVQNFIAQYSGHSSQPATAPTGIPSWLAWQHYLNMFFMVLIVRSGLQVRLQKRPPGYWTAKRNSFFSPGKQPPKKISLTQWFHQLLDVLWVANGILFVVALAATGYWMRIVPTSWDILPNMLSAAIQYISLDWPEENGWIHYNALQVMTYFITVFIAAPLAIISGARMSTWWPAGNTKLSKIYPVEAARAIHIPVMVYFVGFTLVHVFLVFFTGVLRNLNHMFTTRDVVDLWGLVIFALSVVVIAAAWFLTSPMFLRPLAGTMGKMTKN